MRRLLLILIAFVALVPLLPTTARASHGHTVSCASCPAPSNHDADCTDHGCLCCSIAPDAMPGIAPRPLPLASRLSAATFTTPASHRPDFEPPPPRAAG